MTMLFKFALVTLTVHCGEMLQGKFVESRSMAESTETVPSAESPKAVPSAESPKTEPSGSSGNPTSQYNTPALSQGCYYKQGQNTKCGGQYTDWTPDKWGKENTSSWSSEQECLQRKSSHDEYCGTNSEWYFVSGSQPIAASPNTVPSGSETSNTVPSGSETSKTVPSGSSGFEMKIVTWNTYYKNKDHAWVGSSVKSLNPDIFFHAEPEHFDWNALKAALGMECNNNCGFGGHSSYIFYKPSVFDHIESGKKEITTCNSHGWRCNVWMVVSHKTTGRKLILAGSHPSSGADRGNIRNCELDHMFAIIDGLKSKYPGVPVIYGGDMNTAKDSDTMQKHGRLGNGYEYLEDNRKGTMIHWCDQAIDHIVGSKGMFEKLGGGIDSINGEQKSCVKGQWPWGNNKADHLPVYAKVKLISTEVQTNEEITLM